MYRYLPATRPPKPRLAQNRRRGSSTAPRSQDSRCSVFLLFRKILGAQCFFYRRRGSSTARFFSQDSRRKSTRTPTRRSQDSRCSVFLLFILLSKQTKYSIIQWSTANIVVAFNIAEKGESVGERGGGEKLSVL
jgi:hypothetical protein